VTKILRNNKREKTGEKLGAVNQGVPFLLFLPSHQNQKL